jgi:ornithine decarboxylase
MAITIEETTEPLHSRESTLDWIADVTAELETPFFVFDIDSIEQQIAELQLHLKPDRIFYAVKCNDLDPVLATMQRNGVGFEVNNSFELAKALEAGATIEDVINSSSISEAEEVARLHSKGVRRFSIDSFSQIENLRLNAPGAEVYVRITTSNEGSLFDLTRLGINTGSAAALLKTAERAGLKPFGVYFHPGSQSTNPENWQDGIAQAAPLYKEFPQLQILNIGGGLPVQYTTAVPTIEEIADVIHETINKHFERKPLLFAEPGRFLVGQSGTAITSVTQTGQRVSGEVAVVDLSVFTGLIEIIENGNGFQYPMESTSSGRERMYTIIGASCAGTDVIARNIILPELSTDYHRTGKSDRLILQHTGAYTLGYIAHKEKSGFNGCRIPKIYYLRGGVLLNE